MWLQSVKRRIWFQQLLLPFYSLVSWTTRSLSTQLYSTLRNWKMVFLSEATVIEKKNRSRWYRNGNIDDVFRHLHSFFNISSWRKMCEGKNTENRNIIQWRLIEFFFPRAERKNEYSIFICIRFFCVSKCLQLLYLACGSIYWLPFKREDIARLARKKKQ